jgi:hypothetical protein
MNQETTLTGQDESAKHVSAIEWKAGCGLRWGLVRHHAGHARLVCDGPGSRPADRTMTSGSTRLPWRPTYSNPLQ